MPKFNKILVGAAFSPNLKVNIIQACRFATYFNAKLYVVHIGASSNLKLEQLNEIVKNFEYKGQIEFIFKEGKPIEVLSDICEENKIDLLILGAQQRENIFKHYIGTVAKKLTRKVKCSVLLLRNQSKVEFVKKHIVINGLESESSENTIVTAFYTAKGLSSKKITIVEEIANEGLKVDDDRSLRKATINHERKTHQEDLRIKKIIANIPEKYQTGIEIKLQSIFGRSGYAIGHYARVVRADLLVMDIPKKSGIFKRFMMDDLDFILSELPTDVLIAK
ncbi:universal stress protein [Wenyingzhuangia marina]|uniref:Nucleotide-binding universal stress protein, UspA family n=1 Tax=Wenyingzhuangia marina TaxID=1195760 RepID=A0A1M5WXV2_9FLAO|nr:universal stress protein [Wenyingzhuangia marina]GGF81919.1 hypothetical protein GCM10011397_26090 [Wenyingzhuangia marina]SHH92341.1 Nucleotide-binding universal stress protein, UspA family [Wenyingzhuangia marina]